MPIEIRELHIRAVVGDGPGQDRSGLGSRESSEEDQAKLIDLCVERVMEILSRQKDR